MKKSISILLSLVILISSFVNAFVIKASAKEYIYLRQGTDFTFTHFASKGFSPITENGVQTGLSYNPADATFATTGDYRNSYAAFGFTNSNMFSKLMGKTLRLSMDITVSSQKHNGQEEQPSMTLSLVGSADRGGIFWKEKAWMGDMYNVAWNPIGQTQRISFVFTPTTTKDFNWLNLRYNGVGTFTLKNITIAEFADTVSANSSDNTKGSVTVTAPSYAATVGTAPQGKIALGETVTFKAIPKSGCEFKNWTNENGDEVSTSDEYSTVISGDMNLTANFTSNVREYLQLKQGTDFTFTHFASKGFSPITEDGVQTGLSYNPADATFAATGDYRNSFATFGFTDSTMFSSLMGKTLRLSMNITVSSQKHNGQEEQPSMTFSLVGSADRSGIFWKEKAWMGDMYNVAWNPVGQTQRISFVFTPTTTKDFNWLNLRYNGVGTFTLTNITITEFIDNVSAITSDETAGAATVSPPEYTTSVGTLPKSKIAVGEEATFTAMPKSGYEFKNWTDENGVEVSTSEIYTEVLYKDKVLFANFEKTPFGGYIQNFDKKDLSLGEGMSFVENAEDTENPSVTLFYDSTKDATPSASSSNKHRINLYNPSNADVLYDVAVSGKEYFVEFSYKVKDTADQGIEVAFAEGNSNIWGGTWVGNTVLKDTDSKWKTIEVKISKENSGGGKYLHMWLGNADTTKLGSAKVWIDNVRIYRVGSVTVKKSDEITVTPTKPIDYSHAIVGSAFSFKVDGEFDRVKFNNKEITADGKNIYTVIIEDGENVLKIVSPGLLLPELGSFNAEITDMGSQNASSDNTKWYRPAGGTATIVTDGIERYLDLNGAAYAKLRNLEKNQRYAISFNVKLKDANKTPTSDIVFAVVNGSAPQNSVATKSADVEYIKSVLNSSNEEWVTATIFLDVDSPGTADAISLQGSGEYYIDNIEIYPAEECSVSATTETINGIEVGGTTSVSDGKTTGKTIYALQGSEVSFVAKPFKGYDFVGWFKGDSAVALSTEKEYTVIIYDEVSYIAVFKKAEADEGEQSNLIKDGSFSFTSPDSGGKIRWLNAHNRVTYDSGRDWFIHGGTTRVMVEDGNKFVSMTDSGYVMQTVRIQNNKEYILSFKARSSAPNGVEARIYGMDSGQHNVNESAPTLYETSISNVLSDGKWHTYSFKITPTTLTEKEVVIYIGRTMAPIEMDDISLIELEENSCFVGTTVFRKGSADVKGNTVVKKGDNVTFVATPDKDTKFLGWYEVGKSVNGFVSTSAEFTTAIKEDTTLMAVFGGEQYADTTYGLLNGDAELGDTSNWDERFRGEGSKLTVTDDVKHGGKYGFQVDFTGLRQGVAPIDPVLLKGKCKYTFKAYFKVDDKLNQIIEIFPSLATTHPYIQGKTELKNYDINLRTDLPMTVKLPGEEERSTLYSSIRINPTNSVYMDAAQKNDGWYEFIITVDVPVAYDCTVAYFGFRANLLDEEKPALYYIDDVSVTEEEIDYSTRRTDETYSADIYNEFNNGDFENKNSLELPKGFSILKGNKAQGNYLNVSAGAGELVIPIDAKYLSWYHLGFDSKAKKSGTSYIGITFTDPTGTDLSKPDEAGITAFNIKASNDFVRDGFKYFSETKTKKAWIVIYGGSNDFALDNIYLFKGQYASNVNVNDVHPGYYDYDGVGITTDKYDLKWSKYLESSLGDSPSTGDEGVTVPLVILVVSLAMMTIVVFTKKKEVK